MKQADTQRFWRDFGAQIRAQRIMRRLSQEHLAELLGTSATLVSQWECGRKRPFVTSVYRLSRVLGCPIEAFFPPLAEWHPTAV